MTDLALTAAQNHPILNALSWFCGVSYTFLFVVGMAIQNVVNYKN